MNAYTINCSGIDSPRALHLRLAEVLSFPAWYGHNLDALHDVLTSIGEDTELTLTNFTSLPAFGNGFRRVLTDCQRKNPHLKIVIA